jgi:PAS domain S-box-containing protein
MDEQYCWNRRAFCMGVAVLAGLYLARLYNYLLFHTLVEVFSIVVACGIFVIAWNARRFMANNYFLFIGIAFFFVGAVDFLHTLAYKGMGVFTGYGANLPTQLWVVARYLQCSSLLVAPFFIGRKLKPGITAAAYLVVTALLLAAVFGEVFPDCFVEGQGLTPFKKWSEYLVCFMLVGSLVFMRKKTESFDRDVVRLLSSAIGVLIASELAFTLYTDVYGITNMLGHFLKFAGFYLVYKAIIETGLARPYDLLFRELKESEERYRQLYLETPVMLQSIDRGWKLVNVSNYWLEHLGYERDEVIDRRFTDFFSAESRRYAEEEVLPRFFRTGFCKEVPYRVIKKNGEVVDVLLTAAAERDEKGELARSLAVMVDVTARKRAEQEIELLNRELAARATELEEANCELEATLDQLEAANQELEAFNYTVSHDLRTPLTCIDGYSNLLLEFSSERLDEQGKGFIVDIRGATDRMEKLISALLNFSRVSRSEVNRTKVDLSELARAVAAQLRINEPGRRVAFTIAEGLKADGDSRLLRAVLENLIGNAWKYTGKREEAAIEFGTTGCEGEPAYFVRDTGAGFDMEEAGRLFAPFQRLHRREEFEGSGIGLATVKRIIERHGGRVWAEGEVGKGATFYFTLA